VTPEWALIARHDVDNRGYVVVLAASDALTAADARGGPVLDVGAGTGRVALHLAAQGYPVVALDTEPALLAALEHRAGGLPVETVVGDARALDLGRRFGLIIAPMQTVQLLGGPDGRAAFLAGAREHLLPDGLLASAIAHPLEGFDTSEVQPPAPDLGEAGDVQLISRPIAIREAPDHVLLVREREAIARDGTRTLERDETRLDRLAPETFAAEGAAAGLREEPSLEIPATDEYIAATVVMLRA
jgi:SAM-dependent methyltransferase